MFLLSNNIKIRYNNIMSNRNYVMRNSDIILQKTIAILLCFTIVFIPISVCWLYLLRAPTEMIKGSIINKRTLERSVGFGGFASECYLTIETKELKVSRKIYDMLSVGDNISAAYRKGVLYYCTV